MPKGIAKNPKRKSARISRKLRGRKLLKKHIEKIRKRMIGKRWTEKHRKHQSGENHWNYGGISPNRGKSMSQKQKEKIRQSHLKRWDKIGRKQKRPRHDMSEYRNWKLMIFKRDNYACMGCGRVGGYLEAHHIKSWAKYPKLRFILDNGITLCHECHKRTDNYGRKINKDKCLEEE